MAMTAAEVDVHVGRRMRQRRESLGISQGRLGRHLGLTFSQVQKYEKGTNRIGAGRLYLLAAFLGVPVQYFYEGVDETQAVRNCVGHAGLKDADVTALDDAFLSITDVDTRRSLLALVCSVAASKDASGRPRRSTG
jgi:transcriptional regulator with XRE-family HTH domain